MLKFKCSLLPAAFALAFWYPPTTGLPDHQVDSAVRGREIAIETDRRAREFGDYQARLEMVLHDRRGRESRRELEILTLELPEAREKSLVYFHSPRDIRGTALLTYSYPDRENEQWLYLPALRRTKRISATGRSSPFMGSEFAYEDLVITNVDTYQYRYLREEELQGQLCFVIERYPEYEGTGYSKQQLWIDVAEYRILQIDSWDLRDRRLKTLNFGAYQRFLDRLWMPGEARMVNHRTDESTLLTWHDYQFETGLTESDFGRGALGRVR